MINVFVEVRVSLRLLGRITNKRKGSLETACTERGIDWSRLDNLASEFQIGNYPPST